MCKVLLFRKGIAPTSYEMRYFKSLYTKNEFRTSDMQVWEDSDDFMEETGIR